MSRTLLGSKLAVVTIVVLTGVEALDDGRGIYKVAPAQDTHQMLIHFAQKQPARPLHSLTCNTEMLTVTGL